MIMKTLTATAVAMFAAVPAIAGNVAPPVIAPAPTMPAPAPVSDWTGFYAGVNGAVGIVNPGATTYWGGGVHAGYLYDSGDFVVGGELSYNYVAAPANDHLFGADLILGYDAGMVMPHVTLGGSYLVNPNLFGVSAGAGLSVKATENVILTGRYRYTYEPAGGNSLHQGIAALSFRF